MLRIYMETLECKNAAHVLFQGRNEQGGVFDRQFVDSVLEQ